MAGAEAGNGAGWRIATESEAEWRDDLKRLATKGFWEKIVPTSRLKEEVKAVLPSIAEEVEGMRWKKQVVPAAAGLAEGALKEAAKLATAEGFKDAMRAKVKVEECRWLHGQRRPAKEKHAKMRRAFEPCGRVAASRASYKPHFEKGGGSGADGLGIAL